MYEFFTSGQVWNVLMAGLLIPVVRKSIEKALEKSDDKKNKQHDEQMIKLEQIENNLTTQGQATKSIIRYRLIKNMGYAINKGYTTSQELQEMVNLYDNYKSLGGNGVVDKIYSDFTKLRIDDKRGE